MDLVLVISSSLAEVRGLLAERIYDAPLLSRPIYISCHVPCAFARMQPVISRNVHAPHLLEGTKPAQSSEHTDELTRCGHEISTRSQ